MSTAPTPTSGRTRVARLGIAAAVAIVLLHAAYAITTGIGEIADLLSGGATHRLPLAFALHAVAGGIALALLPLQLSTRRRVRAPRTHRIIGRTYVSAVLVAAPAAMATALMSDRHTSSWWSFTILALLWTGTTIQALRAARDRRITDHRRWMLRSTALTAFFITFEPWVGVSVSLLPFAHDISVAIGVTLAWALNLAAAEAWLRRTPARTGLRTQAVATTSKPR